MASSKKAGQTEQALKNIIQGAQTVLTGKTISFRGTTLTQAQVVQAAQAQLAFYLAVNTDRAQLKQDVQTRNQNDASSKLWVSDFKLAAGTMFGQTSVEISEFGFTPKKNPTPLTADQKVLKTARSRATRVERNTLGSKQKKSVKGQVTSVQVTAIGAPAPVNVAQTPATAPTPTPSPSPAVVVPATTTASSNGSTTSGGTK
jgi:hypothetical protein